MDPADTYLNITANMNLMCFYLHLCRENISGGFTHQTSPRILIPAFPLFCLSDLCWISSLILSKGRSGCVEPSPH